jgi:hypothetical protein
MPRRSRSRSRKREPEPEPEFVRTQPNFVVVRCQSCGTDHPSVWVHPFTGLFLCNDCSERAARLHRIIWGQ